MTQALHAGLPVLPIEFFDADGLRTIIQTVDIYINAIRIGPRCIEGLDTADFAEGVFGHARVECIDGQKFLSSKQSEFTERQYQVKKAGFVTN